MIIIFGDNQTTLRARKSRQTFFKEHCCVPTRGHEYF